MRPFHIPVGLVLIEDHVEEIADSDVARTGNAVVAAGAGNGAFIGAVAPRRAAEDCDVFGVEHVGPGTAGVGKVVHDVLHGRHAAYNDAYFRHVPQVVERPFHRGAFARRGVEYGLHLFGRLDQKTVAQRLHDGNPHSPAGCVF